MEIRTTPSRSASANQTNNLPELDRYRTCKTLTIHLMFDSYTAPVALGRMLTQQLKAMDFSRFLIERMFY